MKFMDIQDLWANALKKTEIIKSRLRGLSSTQATVLPYRFLAESSVNPGDTLVRSGKVSISKPAIILPNAMPQMNGFDFEDEMEFNQDTVLNFLLVRGVSFPSLKYQHKTASLDLFEGKLSAAIKFHQNDLAKKEDIDTALLTGPEDSWQFSLLILMGLMVSRSANDDMNYIMEEWRRRSERN